MSRSGDLVCTAFRSFPSRSSSSERKEIMKLQVVGQQHSRTEHTCVVNNPTTPFVADTPLEQVTLRHVVTEELRNAPKSQERQQILESEEQVAVHWHCITSRTGEQLQRRSQESNCERKKSIEGEESNMSCPCPLA